MKLLNIITHNFWLKIISLVLAVATWFYVFDLVNPVSFTQKPQTAEDVFARYQFTIKEVPVKLVFTGASPEGYRVEYDKVKVTPSSIAIFGPEEVVEAVDELRTKKIDLGKFRKTTKVQLGIVSDVKMLQFKDKVVEVYLPVGKGGEEKSVR